MKRIMQTIQAGAVQEKLIYSVSDRRKDISKAPRVRFHNEEERQAHKQGISRRRHARIVNENFGPSSLYSTLTFDNEDEMHTFAEARSIRDNFARRLQYHYPEARIMVYMGRGKNTQRIHFHMLSSGIPAESISKQWLYGTVLRIENLREHNYYDGIDHGCDYTSLANYLWGHWTEEQGGHHWRGTKNLAKPCRDEAKEITRNYTENKPPRPPKGYKLVESSKTPYGLYYFKYVKEPPDIRITDTMKM